MSSSNAGALRTTSGYDQRIQLAGEGRDDTCTESDFRDTCVLLLALLMMLAMLCRLLAT